MGSVRGEFQVLTCNPTQPLSIQQSLLAALKDKKKNKQKHTAVVQREESSHRETFVNAACFSYSKTKKETRKRVLEKLVLRKAGTGGKKRKILQENKLGSVPVH